jgi:glycosyltransferase involved in cell wall biosynthesis
MKTNSFFVSMNGSLADQGVSIGGGDQVMFNFLRSSELDCDVLLPKSARSFVRERGRLFLTLGNLRKNTLGIMVTFLVRIVQSVWLGLRNEQVYDVALAASPYGVDMIPVWCWKARRKGIVIFHVIPKRKPVGLDTRIRFLLADIEQRIMLKVLEWGFDFIIAGNEFTALQLRRKMPEKAIHVHHAGFDAEAIDRVPPQRKDPNLACFIGRLVSQKGIFDLLKVMVQLKETQPDLRLVMVGTGPEQELLKTEMERLGLAGRVTLAGHVSDLEKITLLKKSAFFLFPSYEEGWGIALAEALYCECRCVCYELPHYRATFQEFLSYAKLGDAQDFFRCVGLCGGNIRPGQKDFISRYAYPIVVKELGSRLIEIAESPLEK